MGHKDAWHPPVAGLAPGLKFRLAGLGSSLLSMCKGKLLGFVFPCFSIKKESFTQATGLAAAYFSVLSPLSTGCWALWPLGLTCSLQELLPKPLFQSRPFFLLLIPSSPSPGPGIPDQSQSLLGASSPPPLYTLISSSPLCGSSFLPVF